MKFPLLIIISILAIFVDLATKYWAQNNLTETSINFFGDLAFVLQFNPGIAFSLPLKGVLQVVLSLALLSWLMYYAYKEKWLEKTGYTLALGLIIGGAFGNLYERIVFQEVTDFIQVFSWFPVFNIADACVFIGVSAILVLDFLQKDK